MIRHTGAVESRDYRSRIRRVTGGYAAAFIGIKVRAVKDPKEAVIVAGVHGQDRVLCLGVKEWLTKIQGNNAWSVRGQCC